MILLLGASGYYGRAFADELRRRGHSFIPLTRRAFEYTRFAFLFDYVRAMRPVFLINAANYIGPAGPSGDTTEREMAMAANCLLPQMIARVCLMTRTPWAHISSGCIYNGCKIKHDGKESIELDLTLPEVRHLFAADPNRFVGFSEEDEPNFTFRHPLCNFYSGTKALAEEAIRGMGQSYLWRMRLPFNDLDEPCNLLRQHPDALDNAINSLSHLDDCVKACLDLWEMAAPYGIYNVINPGALEPREIVRSLPVGASRPVSAGIPRSNCILDASKILRTGVRLRPLHEAMEESVRRLKVTLRPKKAQ